jgi:hypothetical protein
MSMVNVTLSLDSLNATELAMLQRIVVKAAIVGLNSLDGLNRPDILAAIVDAGVANAGDGYAEETEKVSEFLRG